MRSNRFVILKTGCYWNTQTNFAPIYACCNHCTNISVKRCQLILLLCLYDAADVGRDGMLARALRRSVSLNDLNPMKVDLTRIEYNNAFLNVDHHSFHSYSTGNNQQETLQAFLAWGSSFRPGDRSEQLLGSTTSDGPPILGSYIFPTSTPVNKLSIIIVVTRCGI